MTSNIWIWIAAISGAISIVTGALGAHVLKNHLASEQLASWNTAALYQLLHSVVLYVVATHPKLQTQAAPWTQGLLTAGILLFSGSIYALCLNGPKVFGPVTPLGGLLFIAAWISLVFSHHP